MVCHLDMYACKCKVTHNLYSPILASDCIADSHALSVILHKTYQETGHRAESSAKYRLRATLKLGGRSSLGPIPQ